MKSTMSDAELGKHIRDLLATPGLERLEIYGKPGKEGIRVMKQVYLTWTKQESQEQIRPKS